MRIRWRVAAAVLLALLSPGLRAQQSDADRQSMEELRNTVINLLKTLVERGVITREQAEAMVKSARILGPFHLYPSRTPRVRHWC